MRWKCSMQGENNHARWKWPHQVKMPHMRWKCPTHGRNGMEGENTNAMKKCPMQGGNTHTRWKCLTQGGNAPQEVEMTSKMKISPCKMEMPYTKWKWPRGVKMQHVRWKCPMQGVRTTQRNSSLLDILPVDNSYSLSWVSNLSIFYGVSSDHRDTVKQMFCVSQWFSS